MGIQSRQTVFGVWCSHQAWIPNKFIKKEKIMAFEIATEFACFIRTGSSMDFVTEHPGSEQLPNMSVPKLIINSRYNTNL